MNHQLKSFIVGNSVVLVFYIFMASNVWAMPPEWYIRCDLECSGTGSTLCWCTCVYENWSPNVQGFPPLGPDADGDFYADTGEDYGICSDNCPGDYNPEQQDADGDLTGDVCDADTVYGTVSGAVSADISIEIYTSSCGSNAPEIVVTDEDGYYSQGGLANGSYIISPIKPGGTDYTSNPNFYSNLTVPQIEIQPYDFTATIPTP
jgi:hypothetical protein